MTQEEIRQERIRLFASYLNIMAAGCGIGAIVTAPVALITKGATSDPIAPTFLIAFIILSLVFSIGLHMIARRTLGRL